MILLFMGSYLIAGDKSDIEKVINNLPQLDEWFD